MRKVNKDTVEKWAEMLANGVDETNIEKWAEMSNEFNEYSKTWKILEEMQEIEQFDTDRAWSKLYSKIGKDDKSVLKTKTRTISLKNVFAAAATVIVLIGIGSYFFYNTNLHPLHYANTSLSAQLVNLPDGSKVYLNANSGLTCSKTFGKKDRALTLYGEAFFEVAKNKSKPFIIHTNNAFVKVVGTSFNVNSNPASVEVVVKTGKVEVYSEKEESEHILLLPGEQAFVSKTNEIGKKKNENENYISWLDKKLVFKAMTLPLVINDLMNTYHCNIVLYDTALNNLKITTTFDNDSLDDVMESIALALNLHVEKEGKTYILVPN